LEVAGRIHPSALYLSTVVAIGHLTLRFASATMSEFLKSFGRRQAYESRG
jgi:hypothetical protein